MGEKSNFDLEDLDKIFEFLEVIEPSCDFEESKVLKGVN